MKRLQGDQAIEFIITVKEYITPQLGAMTFLCAG
jgi:hypothetical protein